MTNNVIKKVYKNWVEYQIYWSAGAAGAGDVTWPSSSTNWHLAVFDWTSGKVIKDWWAVPTSKSAASWWTDTSLVTTWEKYTWNSKQDALTTQTAYSSKGSATKVPKITTNTLWQVTWITEVTITQPTVNNATLTIQKNWMNVNTFKANASSDVTANITVNEVPSSWTTGHVLTKTANWYWWAAASGWITNDTTGTTSTVTKIRAWSEAEFNALSSKDATTIYHVY